MIVRSAEERDLPSIAELSGQLGYVTSVQRIGERFREVVDAPAHAVLVAEKDGRCAGWIHVCVVPSLESDKLAEIRGLVVSESLRGSGVGTELINAAEEWAVAHSMARIRVRTNMKRLRTHQFYARRGYSLAKE